MIKAKKKKKITLKIENEIEKKNYDKYRMSSF